MSLFSFKDRSRRANQEQEERLRKARDEAYRQATMQLTHGGINSGITPKEIDAELRAIARELAELGNEF